MSYFLELVQKGDDELTKLNHQEAYRYYSEAHRIKDDPLLLLRMARAVSGISLTSGVMNVGSAYKPFLEDLNRAVSSAEPSKKKLVEEDAAYAACYFASIILSETTKHYANHGIDDTVSDNLEKSKGLLYIAESHARSANTRLHKPAEQLMGAAQSDDLLLQSNQIHGPNLLDFSEFNISEEKATEQSSAVEATQNITPPRIHPKRTTDLAANCALNEPDAALARIREIDHFCNGGEIAAHSKHVAFPFRSNSYEKRKFFKKLNVESAELGIKAYNESLMFHGGVIIGSLLVSIVIIAQTTEGLPAMTMLVVAPGDVVWQYLSALGGGIFLMMIPYVRRLLSILFFLLFISVAFPFADYLFYMFDANPGASAEALALIGGGALAMPSYISLRYLDREGEAAAKPF